MQFLDWFKTPMLHWGIYELTRQQAAELEQRLKTRRTPAARFAGEDTLANHDRFMTRIRPCRDDDPESIVAIINTAAEAYRGVIPADRWHEPYMPQDEFDREIAAGVVFWSYEEDGKLAGWMGLQSVSDVNLIRHAYVLPGRQRRMLVMNRSWFARVSSPASLAASARRVLRRCSSSAACWRVSS